MEHSFLNIFPSHVQYSLFPDDDNLVARQQGQMQILNESPVVFFGGNRDTVQFYQLDSPFRFYVSRHLLFVHLYHPLF